MEKLGDCVLPDVFFVDYGLSRGLVLLRQELVDAGGSVGLVDNALAFKVLGEEANEVEGVLWRHLHSEHVNELHARGFEKRQIVDLLLLELREDEAGDVGEELLLRDCELPDACSEGVLRHAGRDQQV